MCFSLKATSKLCFGVSDPLKEMASLTSTILGRKVGWKLEVVAVRIASPSQTQSAGLSSCQPLSAVYCCHSAVTLKVVLHIAH